jgi:anti-sigma B factor antagonist
MTLECSIEQASDREVIVTVRGDIDLATASDLEACVRGAFSGATPVCVDMEAVTFLDSSGLRALVTLQGEAGSLGASITLRNVPRQVRRVFDLTGLAASFNLDDESSPGA